MDDDRCVITVRLAKSLHEHLKQVATKKHISLNTLCVSALSEVADAVHTGSVDCSVTATNEDNTGNPSASAGVS